MSIMDCKTSRKALALLPRVGLLPSGDQLSGDCRRSLAAVFSGFLVAFFDLLHCVAHWLRTQHHLDGHSARRSCGAMTAVRLGQTEEELLHALAASHFR